MLDVLSFNGDLVYQILNAAGDEVEKLYAYDLTPGIARYMAERFRALRPTPNLEYLVNDRDDAIHIPLPDSHVQVMSCYERLEHFQNPVPLLKEMVRVLAPGGRALVVVSNRYYPHLYRYQRMRKQNYALGRNWNRGPERKYEQEQIEEHFRAAGFRVAGMRGLQPVHLKAAAVAESLARRAGLHGAADFAADWAAQRYVTDDFWKYLSSSFAYELERT